MKYYTIYDLGMNVEGQKFILPFDVSISDEIIMTKTHELFINYFNIPQSESILDNNSDTLQIHCMYEGYDGYYSYEIVLEVFRLKYDKEHMYHNQQIQNGQLMVALSIQAEELLRELIDIKVLPNMIEKLGLIKF